MSGPVESVVRLRGRAGSRGRKREKDRDRFTRLSTVRLLHRDRPDPPPLLLSGRDLSLPEVYGYPYKDEMERGTETPETSNGSLELPSPGTGTNLSILAPRLLHRLVSDNRAGVVRTTVVAHLTLPSTASPDYVRLRARDLLAPAVVRYCVHDLALLYLCLPSPSSFLRESVVSCTSRRFYSPD